MVHKTTPVQVWADIDVGIADLVKELNAIPGVRTYTSCQGTINDGEPEPYDAYVMVSWLSDDARVALEAYDFVLQDKVYGIVYQNRIKPTENSGR